MIQLTDEMILSDIAGYEQRIEMAKQKLSELPLSAVNWKDRKKIQGTKRELEGEITHIRQIIRYANEALSNRP